MTAFVLTNAQGAVVSVGTVVANPLPAGITANQISDADFTAIIAGLKRWSAGSVVDTGLATNQTNGAAVLTALAQAIVDMASVMTDMDTLLAASALPAGSALTTIQLTTIVRQLDSAARTTATDLKSAALRVKQAARMLNGDFSASA